ncbi:hypothetical protein QAD02_021015 [Eretmocerus hayati]|uniref:Uncharacterized protein n=1 Tax=Eretmocerus hayati TaxID=131215 RepID=A0ACC2PP97_9HYME|nr:hypothetical protein QAD02_021015 [Eretmocerus hayati]
MIIVYLTIQPTKERLFFIGDALIEVFIYEDRDIYIGENSDGSVKGKLPSRVRTVRGQAIKTKYWKSPYERKKKVTVATLQSIAYFKANKAVDANFIHVWNENRDVIIHSFGTTSILSIFSEFIFLSEANGYQRLVDDYNSQREVRIELSKKWPSVANFVFKIAQSVATKNSRNKKDLKQILSGQIPQGTKKQDYIENAALKSLPHILGSVTCKIVANSKDSWKATVAEAQESFILHIEDYLKEQEELPKRMKALKALFAKNKL